MKARTPKSYSGKRALPAVMLPPEDAAHPLAPEYLVYTRNLRFPKTFAEWREDRERREQGKSAVGANLQRWMDSETFCQKPLSTRIHRGPKQR